MLKLLPIMILSCTHYAQLKVQSSNKATHKEEFHDIVYTLSTIIAT